MSEATTVATSSGTPTRLAGAWTAMLNTPAVGRPAVSFSSALDGRLGGVEDFHDCLPELWGSGAGVP
jgi:hypothetical protein